MNHNDQCISVCNKLLRGELSAVETYAQAIAKFEGQPQAQILRNIQRDHIQSVEALKRHIYDMGATPDHDSGVWGSFAQAVEGTAKMMGEKPAIAALKQGEEHGINDYKNALNNPDVMGEAKDAIRDNLLPRLRQHVSALDGLAS